jgi:rubredoxin
MARRYRIVFMGLTETEPQFITGMSSRFGVSQRTVKQILENAPMVLKKHLTLGEAREYAEALQRVGGKVHIQEHGESEQPERERVCAEIKSFGDFTVCPECGFTQLKADSCVKCGFIFSPDEKKTKSRGRDRSC